MVDSKPLVVGRYALCGELGSGGMGTVYVGRLAGPLGFARTVAIKRMHRHFAGDPVFTRLFLDEARLAARVSHANVVATLDVVNEEDELLVVLEYIAGGAFSAVLRAIGKKGARLPLKVVGTIVSQALNGLHAVHEARDEDGKPLGLIHRDVAPDNILVGSDGVARVIDFGIAKATELGKRTSDNKVKGKLRYMAPEHLRGEPIDRRADLYAAGSVLFEALTGRYLLQGSNDVEQIANYHKLDEPKKTPSTFVPSLSPTLDALVLKALAFDREERFATALEMARAVEAELGLAPPSAVAEVVESILTGELSRRRELVEAAIAKTKGIVPPASAHASPSPTPAEPRASDPGNEARPGMDVVTRKQASVSTLLSGLTGDDQQALALVTRDIEVVDLSALAPKPSDGAFGPTLLSPSARDASVSAGAQLDDATTAKRGLVAVPSVVIPDLAPAKGAPTPKPASEALELAEPRPPPSEAAKQVPATHAKTPPPTPAEPSTIHPEHPLPREPPRDGRPVQPKAAAGRDGPPPSLPGQARGAFQWSFLIPVLVIGLAVGAFVWLRGDDVAETKAAPTAGVRVADTAEQDDCDTMRLRIKSGGQPFGLSRRGWTVDLWYRSQDPVEPPAAELDALAGQDAKATVSELRLKGGVADGRVVSIVGERTQLAYDYDRYSALVVAADRFFDVVKADQAALVLRCSHLSFYDTGLWFRAHSPEDIAASMIMLFGLFNDVPLIEPPALAAGETPFMALRSAVMKTPPKDVAIILQKQGGTVDLKGRSTRATFAPSNYPTVIRATRMLMEEAQIKGR